MNVQDHGEPSADWGKMVVSQVRFVEPRKGMASRKSAAASRSIRKFKYVWQPPDRFLGQLPEGFNLEMFCLVGSDGVRRFVPAEGVHPFVLKASLGGCAIMSVEKELNSDERSSYHAMRLLYQIAPFLREHLARSFRRGQDLYISTTGRDDSHVLPAHVGQDARGKGRSWAPQAVIERGRQEAERTGQKSPDTATCIRLGLLVAAQRNPIDAAAIAENQARAIVRFGLFDVGPLRDKVEDGLGDLVQRRVFTALSRHLGDGKEKFGRWLLTSTDNLVHVVAKQKKGGGQLSRDVVRQALLELVFRAFTYVGDCVHLQMSAFRLALHKQLTARERSVFDWLYAKQPCLGGLPPVLLWDRLDFLREAIDYVWEKPEDPKCIGALVRMLNYYAEMVAKRRDADRRAKSQSHHANRAGRTAKVFWLIASFSG